MNSTSQLASVLSGTGCPCLLIGGHALARYGVVRQTLAIDFMIVADDLARFRTALATLGYAPTDASAIFQRFEQANAATPPVDLLFVSPETMVALREGAVSHTSAAGDFLVPDFDALLALKVHALKHASGRFLKDGGDIVALLKAAEKGIDYMTSICKRFGTPVIEKELRFLYECD
jgi:hypothetical protein